MTNRNVALIAKEHPLTMPASQTVQHACELMWQRRIGAVLVTSDDGDLVGIFTGRDAVHSLAKSMNASQRTLADAMTPNPDTIMPDCTAIDALRKMSDGGYRHLPIVADGKIIGIVSRSDFQSLELDRIETETELWERIG